MNKKLQITIGLALIFFGVVLMVNPGASPEAIQPIGHIYCPECNQTDMVEPIGLLTQEYGYDSKSTGDMVFYCKRDGCIFTGYSQGLENKTYYAK